MEERLDQLFKEKLDSHKVEPSAHAWERLNNQLSGKRKYRLAKRLAIVASFLLLLSAGVVGYRYLNRIAPESTVVSQNKSEKEPQKEIVEPKKTERNSDPEISSIKKPENIPDSHEQPQTVTTDKKEVIKKNIAPTPMTQKEMAPIEQTIDTEVETNNSDLALNSEESSLPAENEIEPQDNTNNVIEKETTYPKIRIIYKADDGSELVADNGGNVFDKGIKKITRFSDEHIITDEVKTKLRNTKEDLLALNFGKLLTKSNKDVEN
jgi:hypothetical protein